MKKIDWRALHEKRAFSPMTPPLAFFSFLYGLGIRIRLLTYRKRKGRSLPGFVVSIGNLIVGGSGKTPAARMLAEWALGEGYTVAILSRGYGGQYKTKAFEVSDGRDLCTGPTEAGDEPYMLGRSLPGVPVVISKKRFLAGMLAHRKFGTNFYILDDGFQHLALNRDLDIVLIDRSNPFGNGRLLPWGPMREPLDQLERADAFIITRSGQKESDLDLNGLLERKFPGRPLFRSDHAPERIFSPNKEEIYGPQILRGKRIAAFAGIARPKGFTETLMNLGCDLIFFKSFPDHHTFTAREIQALVSEKKRLKADYLITTEKDWVRLESMGTKYPDIAYLTIRFHLLYDEDIFFKMVKDKAESVLKT